jgi:transposase
MRDEGGRLLSRDDKLAALRRMLAGENVSALARELGVRRKTLYQWRERFRTGGAAALRGRGRPSKAAALAIRLHGMRPGLDEPVACVEPGVADELSRARRRISALERKVGRQQVELDFFQQALRQVGETRRSIGAPGATASTRSSKR